MPDGEMSKLGRYEIISWFFDDEKSNHWVRIGHVPLSGVIRSDRLLGPREGCLRKDGRWWNSVEYKPDVDLPGFRPSPDYPI